MKGSEKHNMEKKAFSVLLIIVSLTLALGLLPVHGEAAVYDSVVRLHVLANSDSEEDQALKLKVRDDLLVFTAELLSDCKTRDEAAEKMRENLSLFAEAANESLRAHGSDYTAAAELGKEHYPTREYDGMAFPSGDYLSLRIKIGRAEGKNWWCVLFPPLCLSMASTSQSTESTDVRDGFIAAGLTPEQYRIITENRSDGKYKIRFKILEIIEEIKARIK